LCVSAAAVLKHTRCFQWRTYIHAQYTWTTYISMYIHPWHPTC